MWTHNACGQRIVELTEEHPALGTPVTPISQRHTAFGFHAERFLYRRLGAGNVLGWYFDGGRKRPYQ
jgi:hypothetical protein